MRTLYGGPWAGEAGVFLAWAAGLRHAATLRPVVAHGKVEGYVPAEWDEVIVCGRPGWRPLVDDFCTKYVEVDFAGVPCGEFAKGGPSQADLWAMVPQGAAHFLPVHTENWGNQFPEPIGNRMLWRKYGTPQGTWNDAILVHARNRQDWGQARNWPQERWNALAERLTPHRLISVGTKASALHVAGSEDARGLPLDQFMDMAASAIIGIGPSSFPSHVFALCGLPNLVWFGGDEGRPDDAVACAKKQAVLEERYLTAWNPFRTLVCPLIAPDWQPHVESVADCALKMIAHVMSTDRAKYPVEAQVVTHYAVQERPIPPAGGIGVCILTYKQPKLAARAVKSVMKFSRMLPVRVAVFDNSEDGGTFGEWLRKEYPRVTYFQAKRNLGCTIPRNFFARYCERNNLPHFVFMDQDVEVMDRGWLEDMLKPFRLHDNTGMVAWRLANTGAVFDGAPKPTYEPDSSGSILEFPGLCTMHKTAFVIECPYEERMFMWGFDSLQCLRFRKRGWPCRLVQGPDKIIHKHPHSGVNMNPERDAHRARSRKLLRQIIYEEALEEVPGLL